MSVYLHQEDLPPDVAFADGPIAVDTEAMGLMPGRDRLCLVQLSDGKGDEHLVRFAQGSDYSAPRLKALLGDANRLKLYHFARFDIGIMRAYLGIMAAPIMVRTGYDPQLSAGTITAGGTLGILIPPSVMLIVMGPVLGVSVADLYAAAFGPGFLLAGLYITYLMVRSFINPKLGPPVPKEERVHSLPKMLKEVVIGVLPLIGRAAGWDGWSQVQPAAVFAFLAAFVVYLLLAGMGREPAPVAAPDSFDSSAGS